MMIKALVALVAPVYRKRPLNKVVDVFDVRAPVMVAPLLAVINPVDAKVPLIAAVPVTDNAFFSRACVRSYC